MNQLRNRVGRRSVKARRASSVSHRQSLQLETLESRQLLATLAGSDETLLADPQALDSQLVGPAYPQKPDPGGKAEVTIIPTTEWLVESETLDSAESVADALKISAESVEAVDWLPGMFIVETAGEATFADLEPQQVDQLILSIDDFSLSEQQIERERAKKLIPNDPLFGDQWHLRNTGQTGGIAGQDANVVAAWDNYTGDGVLIGVVDDGLEYTHPELNNYVASASYDFNFNDNNPIPDSNFDSHGTSAAGVAAARFNNNQGVSGSAPEASLAGLRLISRPASDGDEGGALGYATNQIDIYSNSWGPFDDGQTLEAPGTLGRAAIQRGIDDGRNGLGAIYTWAAGNGLQSDDNTNYDGYANSRYTIAVTAVNHRGEQSSYAEPGSPILVAAYSDNPGITTTTLGGYTNNFGGTSSATPLASGVVALMLEANPGLGWRDVQHILANSASHNDPSDNDWTTNGAGHLVNHKYGFGAIDALAAVNLAVNWNNVGPEVLVQSQLVQANQAIPDDNATGISSSVQVNDDIRIESVEIDVDITHTYRGDLEIVLVSPSGTESVLAEPHRDGGNNYANWRFMSMRHLDESSAGTWTLRVRDLGGQDLGELENWRLRFHGTDSEPAAPEIDVFLANGDPIESGQYTADFGVLDEGAAAVSHTFLVRNTGDAPLNLTDLDVPAGYRLTNPLVGSLGANQADTFTIELETDVLGTFPGEISITSDDEDENPYVIPVSGEVITTEGAEFTFSAPGGFRVEAGGQLEVSVSVNVPGSINGYQLNFADSQLGNDELRLGGWTPAALWPLQIDDELDTAVSDHFVASATFTPFSDGPFELGTFLITAPETPGEYTLSLEALAGAQSTGVVSPDADYRILDYDKQTIIVEEALAPPARVLGVDWNFTQTDSQPLPGPLDPPETWSSQRSDIRDIRIDFDTTVDVSADDIVLINRGLDNSENNVVQLAPNQVALGISEVTISFGHNELPDGFYELRLLETAVDQLGRPLDGDDNGLAGGEFVYQSDDFYKMRGDFNADGGVSVFDFPSIAYWFGETVPRAPAFVDLNGDGGVSVFDVADFVSAFGNRAEFGVARNAVESPLAPALPEVDLIQVDNDAIAADESEVNPRLIAMTPLESDLQQWQVLDDRDGQPTVAEADKDERDEPADIALLELFDEQLL